MTYRPDPVAQIDGTYWGPSNCVPSITAEIIDRVTVGRLRIAPSRIRQVSGDTSGGLSLSQAADAAATATSGQVLLTALYGLSRGQMRDLAVAGRPFGVVIDCAVTVGTSRRTNWFTGQHAVYVSQYRWIPTDGTCGCELQTNKPHGEFHCEDPGTTKAGYLWWSAELLYRAAERALGGPISVLVGRDTEGVTRTARTKANLRQHARVASKDVGNVKPGQSFAVSETVNGGPWKRPDKTMANGWHHVPGGYCKGEALR